MLSATLRSSMTPSAFGSPTRRRSCGRWRARGERKRRAFAAHLAARPLSAVSAPKSSRASSVRPEPSRPGDPDHLALEDVEVDRPRAALAGPGSSTCSTGAPDVRDRGGGGLAVDPLEHPRARVRSSSAPSSSSVTSSVRYSPTSCAVAQHGHPVADLEDLVEEVRDEQDRDALVAQRAHDRRTAWRPRRRPGCEVGSSRIRTRASMSIGAADRDELLDGDGCCAERRGRVDVEAQSLERSRGRRFMARRVDPPEPARLAAEHDVLRDREVVQRLTSWYTVLMPAAWASAGLANARCSPST